MAFTIGTGGGQSVEVAEPTREMFDPNLGGAVTFSLAHVIYKALEVMGSALGAFVAGFGVQFLERIEPSLVEYTTPLLDMILEQPDLDAHVRVFLEQLKNPQHEGGAAILGGLATQAGGMIVGSLLGALQAPAAYKVNQAIRPTLPDASATIGMWRRGALTDDTFRSTMEYLGFKDSFIDGLLTVSEMRAGASDVVRALFSGGITQADFQARMAQMGVPNADANILLTNYRHYLDPGTLIQGWFRGEISVVEVREDLIAQGFTDVDITSLLNLSRPLPGPGDLVRFGVREAYRDDIAERWGYDEDYPASLGEYMAKWGYNPMWARYYWRAHWALPSVSQGFQMLHRGAVTMSEMQDLLRVSDIPARWREGLTAISYATYTRVDARRMYGLGVLDRDGVKQAYRELGYDEAKAENMTQFTIKYEDANGNSTQDDYRNLTKTVILQAFRNGILDEAEATTRLMGLGYDNEDITLLLQLTKWDKEVDSTPDYEKEYQKDVKSIIEQGYSKRVLSHSDAKGALTTVGYGSAEADYILASVDYWYGLEGLTGELKAIGEAYTSRAYNRADTIGKLGALGIPGEMQAQVINEWDTARGYGARRLTEAQYRKALLAGMLDNREYVEAMRGLGYSEYDIWVLVALAQGADAAGPRPTVGRVM